jgi:hypothetical protein
MQQEQQEQASNIDTSPTNTSSPSFETPEVNASERPPLQRVRKSKQQEAQIAELQMLLQAREREVLSLQQRVLTIMTDESLMNPHSATPTYVNVDGVMVTKLQLLQAEIQQKEMEFHDTLRYLESTRLASPRPIINTPGPHMLQTKQTYRAGRSRITTAYSTTADTRKYPSTRRYTSSLPTQP